MKPNIATDNELVTRAKNGDHKAFEQLINRHRHGIGSWISNLVKYPTAEDMQQEVFIKAWQKLSSFKERSSFKTWLYAIARNHILNHLKAKKNAEHPSLDDPETEAYRFVDDAPSRHLFRILRLKEAQLAIEKVLQGLTPEHRSVVEAYFFEGRSHTDIARAAGVPEGTSRSRLWFALRYLRSQLEHLSLSA